MLIACKCRWWLFNCILWTFLLNDWSDLNRGPPNLWSPNTGHSSPSARCTLNWCLYPVMQNYFSSWWLQIKHNYWSLTHTHQCTCDCLKLHETAFMRSCFRDTQHLVICPGQLLTRSSFTGFFISPSSTHHYLLQCRVHCMQSKCQILLCSWSGCPLRWQYFLQQVDF